jgi:hypothetical protein
MAWEDLLGIGEGGLSALSGIAGSVPAGLYGLMNLYRGPEAAARAVSELQGALTYQPRTMEGDAAVHALGEAGKALDAPFNWLGQKTADLTGSPGLGAAVYTGSQMIPLGWGSRLRHGVDFQDIGGAGYQRGSIGTPTSLTANQEMLKIAQESSDAGLPMAKVRDATGWWMDESGMWKYEIPDDRALTKIGAEKSAAGLEAAIREQGALIDYKMGELDKQVSAGSISERQRDMQLRPEFSRYNALESELERAKGLSESLSNYGTLDRTLHHPDLFEAYPEARRTPSEMDVPGSRMSGARGYYVPADYVKRRELKVRGDLAGREHTGIALHEAGHNVQEIAGLPRGSSPGKFRNTRAKDEWLKQQIDEIGRAQKELFNQGIAKVQAGQWDINRLAESLDQHLKGSDFDNLKQQQALGSETGSIDQYRNTPGEVDADTIMRRMELLPDERAMMPFWDSYEKGRYPDMRVYDRMQGPRGPNY